MKNLVALSGLVVAALLCLSGAAFADGTVVASSPFQIPGQSVYEYTYTITADVAAATVPATASFPIDGWIIGVETNPGATAPTALYDITLLDTDGADVMAGVLNNRSATLSEKLISPQPYVRGPVTITVGNNAVNSAVVVLKITVLR